MLEQRSQCWGRWGGWASCRRYFTISWWREYPWWVTRDTRADHTMWSLQDEPQILGTTNGSIGNRRLFQCHQNHGKFVPMSDLVKEEEFFSIISGHQGRHERDMRSVSRCSSRSDRAPLYMNTGHQQQQQPTYQNHMFETGDWRQWSGDHWSHQTPDTVYDQWRMTRHRVSTVTLLNIEWLLYEYSNI